MSALQLILLGEERLCDFPGMTRGLVAVLLYYDTRKTTVETLRELILGECLELQYTTVHHSYPRSGNNFSCTIIPNTLRMNATPKGHFWVIREWS